MLSPSPTKIWERFFELSVTQYVLENFLPPKRRGKPGRKFDRKDFEFFAPSVSELSEVFTQDRKQSRLIHHYFDHPRFQSAYLLYFYPLHSFKFFSILSSISKTLSPSSKPMTILDLGAGPGTASVGLVQSLLHSGQQVPPLTFHWIDQNLKIMEHGRHLMNRLYETMPENFSAAPQIHFHRADILRKNSDLPRSDLILSGNFLNESSKDPLALITKLLEASQAKHLLCVEPAIRFQAQSLSNIRNQLLEENRGWHSISPCLHDKVCPLATGRDWCHSSQPVEIPGLWFLKFSEWLGSQRSFLKYSHLFLTKDPKTVDSETRKNSLRVVSDPIEVGRNKWKILLCQPDQTQSRLFESAQKPQVFRGDLIKASALKSSTSGRFK